MVKGRNGDGALRESTEIVVNLMRDSVAHRLRWRQDGQGEVVEEYNDDGQWQTSLSEAINAERFPVRLVSQGQIAAMAEDNRQALLDIIDEAAKVEQYHRTFNGAKDEYLSMRAKLRVLKGRLTERPELQRKLTDVVHKLEAFTNSHHTDVLKTHQRMARQRREIEETLEQLRMVPDRIATLTPGFTVGRHAGRYLRYHRGCRRLGVAVAGGAGTGGNPSVANRCRQFSSYQDSGIHLGR